MQFVDDLAKQHGDKFYAVFRILAGFGFALHGMQKLFGMFGGIDGTGGTVVYLSVFGLAGLIEFAGGLAILVGFFVRPIALVAVLEMVIAQGWMHISRGWNPLMNGGEASLLYLAAFLAIFAHGAGIWSVDGKKK